MNEAPTHPIPKARAAATTAARRADPEKAATRAAVADAPAQPALKPLSGGGRSVVLTENVNMSWTIYAPPAYELEDFERPEAWIAAGLRMSLYDRVRIIQGERTPPRVIEAIVSDHGVGRTCVKVQTVTDMPVRHALTPAGDGVPLGYRIEPAPADSVSRFQVIRVNSVTGESHCMTKGRQGIDTYEAARAVAIQHYNATTASIR